MDPEQILYCSFGGYFVPWIQIRRFACFREPGSGSMKPDSKHWKRLLTITKDGILDCRGRQLRIK